MTNSASTAIPAAPAAPARIRSTSAVIDPVHTFEGAGFPVRRPFPVPALPHLDPFLMVDQTGPLDLAPGQAKGAPDHPHRGFAAVSYVIEGAMAYADSTGARGVTEQGAAQWLTAGSGILHANEPVAELLRHGGRQHQVQIWVNLPARLKTLPPSAQDHGPADIPVVRTPDGSSIKVLAGRTHGATGPFRSHTPVLLVHAELPVGGTAEFTVPSGHNAGVLVLSGSAALPDAVLADGRFAVLAGDGDRITVSAPETAASLLLLAGEPIGEPIARSGPFVMNTAEEIRQAQADFQAGRFGIIPPA